MDILNDKYGRLTVVQLKALLREREASVKGKKKDLIERLIYYDQNHNFKLNLMPNVDYDEVPLPTEFACDVTSYRDINADTKLPPLVMPNIKNYLDRFAVNIDAGKRMYENNFLLSVRMTRNQEGYYIFISRCKASMKPNIEYISNFLISPQGFIDRCQCDCAVGGPPSAHCKHIVAALLAVEQMKREGTIILHQSSTQKLQQFHKPKKTYFGSPVKAKDLPGKKCAINFKPIFHKMDNLKYREKIRNMCINFLSISSSTMPFKHTIHPANMYAVVSDHDYDGNGEEQMLKLLKIDNVTREDMREIEESTRKQDNSKRWHDERCKRITASQFYSCCTSISHETKNNLAQRILYPTNFTSKQTQHGKDCEPKAIKQYMSTGVNVKECGLIIMKNNPCFAASPDGLIEEDTVLEVKCPYNQRNVQISAKTIPFLCEDDCGRLCLDPIHQYYYQIQGQLMVTERQYGHLLVYTFVDCKSINVPRDNNFIVEMKAKLIKFYYEYFKPALLEKYLYKNYGKCFFK